MTDLNAFEKGLLAWMSSQGKGVRDELAKLKDIDKTLEPKLIEEIKKYKASGWKK